jgi:hypothetical protein
MRQIDRKFHITDQGEIADSEGNVLPEDMPLFLLLGRDALAVKALREYEMYSERRAGDAHLEALHLTIADFIRYRREHPDQMKVPQGSDADDYSRSPKAGIDYGKTVSDAMQATADLDVA